MTQLHIPAGINYECSGCGNCCLEWPVPLTPQDVSRITSLAAEDTLQSGAVLFRSLRRSDVKLQSFTNTLEKRNDGRCEFLCADSRCLLHSAWGAEAKPEMCQLFPYTFTETPSGIYASLSFASSGALYNFGRALTDQAEVLEERWGLFKCLFPLVQLDWSSAQLIDGQLLSWTAYLNLEEQILSCITQSGAASRVDLKLDDARRFIAQALPAGVDLDCRPKIEASQTAVDQLLLRELFDFYLPDNVFAEPKSDLNVKALLEQFVAPPCKVQINSGGRAYSFKQLLDYRLGSLDAEAEDLLFRFVYCRIFSKLYFGAGFANLSLLAGFNHLIVLVSLVRLKVKMMAQSQQLNTLGFFAVAEIVRALDRQLSQAALSKQSVAVLEVLLSSPERIERIFALAA